MCATSQIEFTLAWPVGFDYTAVQGRREQELPAQGLPVLDIIDRQALGGDALALSTARAGPSALRQVLPVKPHTQQVEAAGASVTQSQGTVVWMMHLQVETGC